MKQKITFYTPAFDEKSLTSAFGCATLGFNDAGQWVLPDQAASIDFPLELDGTVFTGSYEEVKARIAAFENPSSVKAGMVLFGNCGGEEAFLAALIERFPGTPFAGGSPAIGGDGQIGRMIGGPAQVSVFLITDQDYEITVTAGVPHYDLVEKLTVLGDDPRLVEKVRRADGSEAEFVTVLDDHAAEYGVTANKTELLAINDGRGRNMHLVDQGGCYAVGANLPADRKVEMRHVTYELAYDRMKAFYQSPASIIFGCAGLKGLLGDKSYLAASGTVGLFMFGEVMTNQGGPQFANLSLSRMEFKKK